MGWLTKLFKGSSNKGRYHRKYSDESIWDAHTTTDALSDHDNEDVDHAIALSLIEEEDQKGKKVIEEESHLDDHLEEDEQFAMALQESLDIGSPPKYSNTDSPPRHTNTDSPPRYTNMSSPTKYSNLDSPPRYTNMNSPTKYSNLDSPPRYTNMNSPTKYSNLDSPPRYTNMNSPTKYSNLDSPPRYYPPRYDLPYHDPSRYNPPQYDYGGLFPNFPYPYHSSGYRICTGCKAEIGQGRFLNCMGGIWHPECFRCHTCDCPISDYEFSMSENRPYHKSCYKEKHHPRCDVCKNYIPTNAAGLIEYRAHPFWLQKYCPSHERDGTPRCCSCERMEPTDTRYLALDDGRKLCLECLDSSIMDTHECQPLYLEIQEFYEGLNMKVEQQVPLLLVERQALNEAMEGEKNGHHHMPETRGLCLSEEQTIRVISKRPRIGGYRIVDMFTEPYRLIRRCEVTAILILYGLPRLLTGSILAHEMMHAWLRLNGYPNLSPDVEEGICQVLAHLWLESEIMAGSGSSSTASSSSASSSSSSSPESSSSSSTSSKKGNRSQFEKKLGEFFKHQIESDTSAAYGEGFRKGNQAMLKYGLRRTLDHIRLTGSYPY